MKNLQKILSYILVAMISSTVTMAVFVPAPTNAYSKLDALADLIEIYFIGESDRTAMEDAAAAAMVKSLGDEWSWYMPAKYYQAYTEQMDNAYVGVGITIRVTEDGAGFAVIKVNEGDSAKIAGILPGDVIVAVENQSAAGMTIGQIRDLVRGEAGTQVMLTIRRGDETFEIAVDRDIIKIPAAEYLMLEGNVGLVIIYNFDDRCAAESIDAIEALKKHGATALILDVRSNPGGYKSELVELLDYLLPEGPLFRSEDHTGKITVDESDKKYLDMPMAVLVDENTYSAAEFFAAALDEYDAAVSVGTPTCGKGYFQNTFELNDGSAVSLSIGKYTTPKGVNLAETGFTPKICVEMDEETTLKLYAGTLDPEQDLQIQAAVKALQEK